MSIADAFEVGDSDTVWNVWLMAVNLLDMLEGTQKLGDLYYFAQVRKSRRCAPLQSSIALTKKIASAAFQTSSTRS